MHELCLKQPQFDTLNFYMTQGHHKDSLKTSQLDMGRVG